MNQSALITVFLAVLFVLDLMGRLPKLPKSWRRWLFDEHNDTST
jgi:hypothetical protein